MFGAPHTSEFSEFFEHCSVLMHPSFHDPKSKPEYRANMDHGGGVSIYIYICAYIYTCSICTCIYLSLSLLWLGLYLWVCHTSMHHAWIVRRPCSHTLGRRTDQGARSRDFGALSSNLMGPLVASVQVGQVQMPAPRMQSWLLVAVRGVVWKHVFPVLVARYALSV